MRNFVSSVRFRATTSVLAGLALGFGIYTSFIAPEYEERADGIFFTRFGYGSIPILTKPSPENSSWKDFPRSIFTAEGLPGSVHLSARDDESFEEAQKYIEGLCGPFKDAVPAKAAEGRPAKRFILESSNPDCLGNAERKG